MAGVKKYYPYEPDYAVAPGETLRDTLEALNMTQAELAVRTGLSPRMVNQIISGVERISFDTAFKLEMATGVPASLWNKLESNYRERRARLEDRERQRQDADWLRRLPIAELKALGLVKSDSRDKAAVLQEVLAFFGVTSVSAWHELWVQKHIAARQSRGSKCRLEAVATWIRLGEIAAYVQTKRDAAGFPVFNRTMFRSALTPIRAMTASKLDNFSDQVCELCRKCGLVVVYVREIRGAPLFGASWWRGETPVIQLNLRYKTDDQFWFSFFHEAGHVLNDGRKAVFVNYGKDDNPLEIAANRFAGDFLIPPRYVSELKALGPSTERVLDFARRVGIAPGIVVGRMQREDWLPYSHLNRLKDRFEWKQ